MPATESRITIANRVDSFFVDEMRRNLADGHTVRIAFGGESMRPLIDGSSDIVHLEPLPMAEGKEVPLLVRGDIYLFVYEGRCVIHRLLRADGDELTFRGDNNMGKEHVRRGDVMARLAAVEHADGSVVSCDDPRWHRRSRRVAVRRTVVDGVRRLFSRRQRAWMRWVYFGALLILMWAPMGFVGVPLDNFVFGIRLDHLVHASVYLPCAFFLMDFVFLNRRQSTFSIPVWLAGALLGIVTESVQYLLPYRGFDINDLVANFLGVTLGWLFVGFVKKYHLQY